MLAYDLYLYLYIQIQNLVQTLHKQLAELLIQTKGKCNWKIDQDSSNVFLKVRQELQTTANKRWKDINDTDYFFTTVLNEIWTLSFKVIKSNSYHWTNSWTGNKLVNRII
jgi:hypothetical protein